MSIYEKVSKVQSKLSVKKDWNNPFYKSKYITLDEIMSKLQPLLDENKLLVFNYNLKEWGVRTIVVDLESTDTIGSDFIIWWISDPQQLWKVLTYGRRYNLTSIFNILADEDDDAQSFYDDKGKTRKPKFTENDLQRFIEKKKDEFKNYQEAKAYIEQYFVLGKDLYGKVMDLYASPDDESQELMF